MVTVALSDPQALLNLMCLHACVCVCVCVYMRIVCVHAYVCAQCVCVHVSVCVISTIDDLSVLQSRFNFKTEFMMT